MSEKEIKTNDSRDVAISSRVRFARNLRGYPFPIRMTEESANLLIRTVGDAVGKTALSGEYELVDFTGSKVSPEKAASYAEEHKVSREFASSGLPHALITNKTGDVNVMLCEEDHIRIQAKTVGLSLEEAYKKAAAVDDALGGVLDYAFSDTLGFLTECPTNLGTAMRASVMLFLPALTKLGQIRYIDSGVSKLGLTIRGLYGEGSGADGYLYQISNQVTLGVTESEILEKLSTTVNSIISKERKAREELLPRYRDSLCDEAGRALGTMKYAHRISSSEFISLYASVRLGVSLKLIDGVNTETLDIMLEKLMPAGVTTAYEAENKKKPSESERDIYRAELIREYLK